MKTSSEQTVNLFKVPIDIYGEVVLFILEGDKRTISDWFLNNVHDSYRKEVLEQVFDQMDTLDFHDACTITNGGGIPVVVLCTDFQFDSEHLAVLSHELFHATCDILIRRGIRLTRKSEEAFAYLNGYLHEQLFKQLLPQMKDLNQI